MMGAMGDEVAGSGLPVDDPREAERRLWEAFSQGVLVDLRSGDPDADDPARADGWDESRRVRAEVVTALLLGAVAPVPGHVAAVRLAGALVEGSVNLRRGTVSCAAELTDCCFEAELVLAEARTKTIDLSGSVLVTLDAASAEIAGYLRLDRCQALAIKCNLAHITGNLSLHGANLANPGDIALDATGITVDGGMFCQRGFQAEGEISLLGAHISVQLSLNGAHLVNPGEIALTADWMTVDGGMFCEQGFLGVGQIRLLGAHISGQLSMSGAHLVNPGGTALAADRMVVDGGMFCQRGFQAEGEISLVCAHISGQLGFRGAVLSNLDDRPVLNCQEVRTDSLWLDGVKAIGAISLNFAQVQVLRDSPSGWPGRIELNGFTYDDLQPYVTAQGPSGRLSWLSHTGAEYRAQPYEQLAAYYRRLGHDEEARRVLVAKQRRRRAGLDPLGKIAGYVLDALVGYGYRPGRAFTWLIALIVAGSVYFTINRPVALDPTHPSHYQPVLYAADLVIPIVNLGQSDAWAPAGASQWIAAALTALGWILATAAVAGITRVLTRT
jgi:hypothetical protein